MAEGGAMNDIFLSYASDDRDRVRPLVEALTAAGWSVFWDRTIPFGSTWDRVLSEKLEFCRCLLVVWSRHSVASDWVLEEVHEAKSTGVTIVPVLLDQVKPPLGFRRLQAADLSTWDGKPESPSIRDFIQALQNIIQSAIPQKPSKPLEEPQILAPQLKSSPPHVKPASDPEPLITNTIGMTFVLIPAGTFLMGSALHPEEIVKRYGGEAEWYDDEYPQHQVTLSLPFYLQTTPVTQGHWQIMMENNPSHFDKFGDDCPVERVSWEDAQKFILKLRKMEQNDRYRLPSEAEWEYACRAGNMGEFCFGDNIKELEQFAWYIANSDSMTHPVRRLKPNSWGLYDMHGNVWEWCQDWYGPYINGPVVDPSGSNSGDFRVLRGGSWYYNEINLRSAKRYCNYPDIRASSYGFRVARTV